MRLRQQQRALSGLLFCCRRSANQVQMGSASAVCSKRCFHHEFGHGDVERADWPGSEARLPVGDEDGGRQFLASYATALTRLFWPARRVAQSHGGAIPFTKPQWRGVGASWPSASKNAAQLENCLMLPKNFAHSLASELKGLLVDGTGWSAGLGKTGHHGWHCLLALSRPHATSLRAARRRCCPRTEHESCSGAGGGLIRQ